MFIAGGKAYWITSTYWNKGSNGSRPKCAAALTTQNPMAGSKTSRAMMMQITTTGSTLDDCMPIILVHMKLKN